MYVASGIAFLDSTSTTVIRSMITKIVPATEIGKVFSVVEFLKAILTLVAPVVFGKVYEKTLRTQPNAFIFVGIGCKFMVFFTVLIIYITMTRKDTTSTENNEDSPDNISTDLKQELQPVEIVVRSEHQADITKSTISPPTDDGVEKTPMLTVHHKSEQNWFEMYDNLHLQINRVAIENIKTV